MNILLIPLKVIFVVIGVLLSPLTVAIIWIVNPDNDNFDNCYYDFMCSLSSIFKP